MLHLVRGRATTSGKHAVGEVTVKVDFDGDEPIIGREASTDVVEASAKAYLNAINRALTNGKRRKTVRGV
jgi:2-isopropylmalate synthase